MMVRPTHRQFGTKVRVASELLRLVPRDVTVWVEGFAGTASMTLAKEPHAVEHLNDLNGDVVNLYRVLRDERALQRLCRLVELTPWAQEEFEACRNHVYSTDAADENDPVERARRFLVASWQAIGGKQFTKASWRLDLGRSWLISVWDGVPSRLVSTARRLRECHIHRRHILELVQQFGDRPDALLFLDPPYPRDTLATHEIMYAVDMVTAEHQALAEMLRTVKARVLLTMSAGTLYEEVLQGWTVVPYEVRGLKNSKKRELALMNYTPPAATLFDLHPGSFAAMADGEGA